MTRGRVPPAAAPKPPKPPPPPAPAPPPRPPRPPRPPGAGVSAVAGASAGSSRETWIGTALGVMGDFLYGIGAVPVIAFPLIMDADVTPTCGKMITSYFERRLPSFSF